MSTLVNVQSIVSATYTATVDFSTSGRANNDLLIISLQGDSAFDFNVPAGWTLGAKDLWVTDDSSGFWMYKVSNGTETTVSITRVSATYGKLMGSAYVVRGVSTSSPINAYSTVSELSGTATPAAASVTTTVGGCFIIAIAASGNPSTVNGGEWTPPSGYTEDVDIGAAYNHYTSAHATQSSAGATGSLGFTYANGTASCRAWTIAIAPGSTGPSPSSESLSIAISDISSVRRPGDTVTIQVNDVHTNLAALSRDTLGMFITEVDAVGSFIDPSPPNPTSPPPPPSPTPSPGGGVPGNPGSTPSTAGLFKDFFANLAGTFSDFFDPSKRI